MSKRSNWVLLRKSGRPCGIDARVESDTGIAIRFDTEMPRREAKCSATYFLQMVKEHGGLETAHR
jgi:hypothetical protein